MSLVTRSLIFVALITACGSVASAADFVPFPLQGAASYAPPKAELEHSVDARFRLPRSEFNWEAKRLSATAAQYDVFDIRFPSPVETPLAANNTVHCEYYLPKGEPPANGKRPAVIVLHILGGDFMLSRLFCGAIAQRGTAALFLKMPYYGPRREPGSTRKMISPVPTETVEGMTQAVLDIRRAVGWLQSRSEIDPNRLGVFGISLGGITAALAASAEPRLENVCLLLAGGDIGQVAWDSPEVVKVRRKFLEAGGSKEDFIAAMSQVDPATYAANCRNRRILMLNAKQDEIIPRACTEALWKKFGEPEIVWYGGGHYSVGWHMLSAIGRVREFFDPAQMRPADSPPN